jgi:hypothetical protein
VPAIKIDGNDWKKARMISGLITKFPGHEPTKQEKKQFYIMNRLGESIV